jgi:ubiquitin carboxyl-terminal hydrolase 8
MNIEREKYKDAGLSGLANLGNTCFINSCLQILSHTYELNDFLNLETYKNRLNNKPESVLLLEWDELRKLLWSQNCIINPQKFIHIIHKLAKIRKMDLFTQFSQEDMPEFLLFIIDCFHLSLKREVEMSITGNIETETDKMAVQCFEMVNRMISKDYSEIWNMFYGIHVSQIIDDSLDGNILASNPEPYFTINLSIPPNNKSPTLFDCFDHYVEGEKLDGENAWYNEATGKKQTVIKKIVYWSFPDILVIDLKRFNNRNNKNQIFIDFSLDQLDLSKYVIGYNSKSYIYNLYGICNHSGGVSGGHYTSFIKTANDKWYHFNDTSVQEVSNLSYLVSPKAYCLFFRKQNII